MPRKYSPNLNEQSFNYLIREFYLLTKIFFYLLKVESNPDRLKAKQIVKLFFFSSHLEIALFPFFLDTEAV